MNEEKTIKVEELLKNLCGKDMLVGANDTAIVFVCNRAAIVTWHHNRMYLNFLNTFERMEVEEYVEEWAEHVTEYHACVLSAVDTIQLTLYEVFSK